MVKKEKIVMGNRDSIPSEVKETTYNWPLRVRIGILCMDFTPCKHFVHVEGIPGWAVYDSKTIVKRFIKNPEYFTIDSKFMPEVGIARPDASHFEMYNSDAILPEEHVKVIQMHTRAKRFEEIS